MNSGAFGEFLCGLKQRVRKKKEKAGKIAGLFLHGGERFENI
jgi:hypothetical protein